MSRKFKVQFTYVVEVDLDNVDDETIAMHDCDDDEELAIAIAGSEFGEASPQDSYITVENID